MSDLRALLHHFYGKHLNWQILPYLTENLARIQAPEVIETVLATEKLEDSDKEEFLNNDVLRQKSPESALMQLVHKRLDGFPERMASPDSKWLLETWETIYILVLYMALLEARWPGTQRAEKKVKAFIKFMMEEIKCMFLNVFGIAFGWFSGHPRARLLNPLRSSSSDILAKARNIAWDIYHLQVLPLESAVPPRDKMFLLPSFLTFDRALLDLLDIFGLRLIFIQKGYQFPFCISARPFHLMLRVAVSGEPDLQKHFLPEAVAARSAFHQTGDRAHLKVLRERLEVEILQSQEQISR